MKYLLDTHILLWWVLDSPQLPVAYASKLDALEKAGQPVNISVISLWEIAKLVSLKRLDTSLSLDHWFDELERDSAVHVLPLNGAVILESSRLGNAFPKDPADQLIVATARHHGMQLMTVDEGIIKSGKVLVA